MRGEIKPWVLAMLTAVLLPCLTVARADEKLPRVLVLGDSVHRTMALSAAKELSGVAKIEYPKSNYAGDTGSALSRIDELLGDGDWDVIYFNFGFADLHYCDPNTKTIRAMSKHAGGVRVTPLDQYAKNLRSLVGRLKATKAKLIWASTTPIVSSKFDNLFDPGSEIEYNAIAAEIMAEHQIAINDMHAYVLEHVKDKRDPSPFWFNRVPLHPPVIASIRAHLD